MDESEVKDEETTEDIKENLANDIELEDFEIEDDEIKKWTEKYSLVPQMFIQKKLMIKIKEYMSTHRELNRKMTIGRFFTIVSRDFLNRQEQYEKDMKNPKKKTLIEQAQIIEELKNINQKINSQNPVSDTTLAILKDNIASLKKENQKLKEMIKLLMQEAIASQSLLVDSLKTGDFAYSEIYHQASKTANEKIEKIEESIEKNEG